MSKDMIETPTNYEKLCYVVVHVIPELLRELLEFNESFLEQAFSTLEADEDFHLPEYQKTLISSFRHSGTKSKPSVSFGDFDLSLILRTLQTLSKTEKIDVSVCISVDQIKHLIWTLYKKELSVHRRNLQHVGDDFAKEMVSRFQSVIEYLRKSPQFKGKSGRKESIVKIGYDTRNWIRCIGQDEQFFPEFLPRYTENEICIQCTHDDFPRYKYSLEKAKKISAFLSRIEGSPDVDALCSPPIVAIGGCYGDNMCLISGKLVRRQVLPRLKDFTCDENKPDCMVYFLRDDDDPEKEREKVLGRIKRHLGQRCSKVVVFAVPHHEKEERTHISEEDGICYATINCTHSSVRQYVTSALELKIEHYLQSVRQEVESTQKDLLLRIDAAVKYLMDSSVFLQSKRPPSRFVPDSLKEIILRYKKFIFQYGFWLNDFRIFISAIQSADECTRIKGEIERSLPIEFIWKIKVIRTAKVSRKPKKLIGQGDTLGRGPPGDSAGGTLSVDENKATLGAFVKMHVHDRDEIVALTSGHFILPRMKAFAFIGDEWKELGTCEFRIEAEEDKGFCELSIIRLNQNFEEQFIEPMLRDENDCPKNASIFTGGIDDCIHDGVYKRGASTLWTEGVIIGVQNTIYQDVDHPEQVVVVKSLPPEPGSYAPFATEGDSGSVVFRAGRDAEFNSLEVIAMVNAGGSDGDGTVLTDANEDAESYVLCTNLKVAFELSERQGRRLSFISNEQDTSEHS